MYLPAVAIIDVLHAAYTTFVNVPSFIGVSQLTRCMREIIVLQDHLESGCLHCRDCNLANGRGK